MQALLAEVRQLRLALERSALLTPKIQLTMQRLQLQDQRVARLSAPLDTVRHEIARQAAVPQRVAQQIAAIEQQLSTESDTARRKDLERQRAELRAVTSTQAVDAQLLARESELASSLRTERATLDELSEKLAGMERLLDVPQPAVSAPGR
jgi:hypothetical protein